MNGGETGACESRPRKTARVILGRNRPLRSRSLPPLEQIRLSVSSILSRWPDAVRKPEDRDRENLAKEMLRRISEWDWSNITTQRVGSAAVAIFDEERRSRQDLLPVREFYVTEIASREPGAFLDGMVGVYVESFAPGADHTRYLAQALAKRRAEFGERPGKLLAALPELFRPDAAPLALARIMREADDAYAQLKAIGLNSPHTSGLAKAAQKIFVERLAPDLDKAAARRKLFSWLTPENGPVLQAGAGPAVEALLAAWRDRNPPDALRNELSEAIISAWNDPRLHSGGIWSGFEPSLKSVLLRWLTREDMEFFCNVVSLSQDNHMWPPRRDFWLRMHDDGRIDEAWVAFSSDAYRVAQNRHRHANSTSRFARQIAIPDLSLLIMRIGNKIVVDGCHSYKTHIFRDDDPNAPKLYRSRYDAVKIRRSSRLSQTHYWSESRKLAVWETGWNAMSDSRPLCKITDDAIEIRFPPVKQGLLSRLMAKPSARSFTELAAEDRDLLFSIGDLRAWGDTHPDEVTITPDHLRISHDAAASLSAPAAEALGLPRAVDLMLKTDVTGVLGRPDFRLHYEWSRNGRREHPRRSGAVLHTSDGPRRLPLWMKRALDLADDFDATRPVEDHWRALAEFRRAIEPDDVIDAEMPANREMARLSMTAFLRGLEVRIADRFSIAPDASLGQFEIVPYSSERLDSDGIPDDEISERNAELTGETLAVFQHRLHTRGARPAFQLGNNSYLVIDRGAAPVLEELARAQKAPREERRAFIENPRRFIAHAVTRHLEATGAFEGREAAEQEEMVEAIAGPALVESREYSERVTGVTVYQRPQDPIEGSGTTWLPEAFAQHLAKAIQSMPDGALHDLRQHMADVLERGGDTTAEISGESVKITPARLAAVDGEIERRESLTMPAESDERSGQASETDGPIILDTLDNFEELSWEARFAARTPTIPTILPEAIRTPLHKHQAESFDWALAAWQAGLPGVLNADEQGLGKTLQTIAFLAWLKEHMKHSGAADRGPILVVAPTSLLRNWEQEVETHVGGRGFGTLIRLYGSSLSSQKRRDSQGTETRSGLPQLDLGWLDEAFEDGRAHRYWLLTTYTTLANYQHSLGRVRFSAMVMDEIQNIKNRNTLASKAVEAMNADFRLGLTGTPIENAAIDLWTIMDRIAPGCLGSGTEFRERYAVPDAENMSDLHARIFKPNGRTPPLGLRRLKDEVARDLPQKRRFLHPRLMPKDQADAYDLAQLKLANGGPGAALKMLHHIRSVSVHPGVDGAETPEQFIAKSARLDAVIDILHRIRDAGERVLVFIEHRDMQFRFAEITRHMFGLDRIDVINGDTPIPRRQEIVNRFQRHLGTDGGFDMLILGPKAAGTGLTLTAATHVIHLSRWWNPAVEEQCNDRVHRIGQTRPVSVHVPMALHPELGAQSFDGLLQSLMQRKRKLAEQALWPMGDSKDDVAGLTEAVASQERGQHGVLSEIMAEQFQRDGLAPVSPGADGSYELP